MPLASSDRLIAIDAARGTAMLFACLQHFGEVKFGQPEAEQLLTAVRHVGMIAAPTFLLISGMMLGLLYQTHSTSFDNIRLKLIDRALFLVIVGHLLTIVAHIPFAGGLQAALRWGFVTDTIGFCIVAGCLLITHLRLRMRAIAAVLIYAVSLVAIFAWEPHGWFAEFAKETLFGRFMAPVRVYADNFPLLPWFSLYLVGTCLGEQLGYYQLNHDLTGLTRFLFRAALFLN